MTEGKSGFSRVEIARKRRESMKNASEIPPNTQKWNQQGSWNLLKRPVNRRSLLQNVGDNQRSRIYPKSKCKRASLSLNCREQARPRSGGGGRRKFSRVIFLRKPQKATGAIILCSWKLLADAGKESTAEGLPQNQTIGVTHKSKRYHICRLTQLLTCNGCEERTNARLPVGRQTSIHPHANEPNIAARKTNYRLD